MYERQVITSHRSKKRHRNGFTRSQNEHFSLTDCLDLPATKPNRKGTDGRADN